MGLDQGIALCLLVAMLWSASGCQFIFEPNPEPRYRWVSYPRGGGFWQESAEGKYVWTGKEFNHVVSRADSDRMSKRWRQQ